MVVVECQDAQADLLAERPAKGSEARHHELVRRGVTAGDDHPLVLGDVHCRERARGDALQPPGDGTVEELPPPA